jgi:S1-C subfamily serine protease
MTKYPMTKQIRNPNSECRSDSRDIRHSGFAIASTLGISSFVICLLAVMGPAIAADKVPLTGKEIYQRTLKSTVWIAHVVEIGEGRAALATGSGSLIDVPQRLILTNFRVVGDKKEVRVFFPQFDKGKLIAAKDFYLRQLRDEGRGGVAGKVLFADHKRDLALIKVDKLPQGTPAISLARESVGPGDTVHSIGNPGASDALWAYTPGSVKAVYKKSWMVKDRSETHHFEAQVVETTSPVNPGDSGGPLMNGQGELVAVTQGGVVASQGTISFFIDVSEVRALLAGQHIRVTNGPAARVVSSVEPKPEPTPKESAAEQAEKEEKAARAKLNLIEDIVKDRPERARERLEELIKQYPNTKAAKEAKEMLAKLKRG